MGRNRVAGVSKTGETAGTGTRSGPDAGRKRVSRGRPEPARQLCSGPGLPASPLGCWPRHAARDAARSQRRPAGARGGGGSEHGPVRGVHSCAFRSHAVPSARVPAAGAEPARLRGCPRPPPMLPGGCALGFAVCESPRGDTCYRQPGERCYVSSEGPITDRADSPLAVKYRFSGSRAKLTRDSMSFLTVTFNLTSGQNREVFSKTFSEAPFISHILCHNL